MYGLRLRRSYRVVLCWCATFVLKPAYSRLAKYSLLISCVVRLVLQKGQFLMILAGEDALSTYAMTYGMHMNL